MLNSSIWPIDRTLSGATTPGQSGIGGKGNERVLHISQKAKVKLATIVDGNPKAPFSIATTQRCKEGHNSFPRIALLYPWNVPYIAEWKARRYQVPFFESLVWRDLELNPAKLQHYWSLIRLFSVISKRLVGGVLPFYKDAVRVFCSPSGLGSLLLRLRITLFII